MWHEQSRPDRDNYVNILKDNIQPKRLGNYGKHNNFSADSLGTPYDYGSILHHEHYFKKAPGLKTMEIINQEWHAERGFPVLGGTHP